MIPPPLHETKVAARVIGLDLASGRSIPDLAVCIFDHITRGTAPSFNQASMEPDPKP